VQTITQKNNNVAVEKEQTENKQQQKQPALFNPETYQFVSTMGHRNGP
jgi:hypothetical protein